MNENIEKSNDEKLAIAHYKQQLGSIPIELTEISEHQVILASIYEFDEIKKTVIEMKKNLFL